MKRALFAVMLTVCLNTVYAQGIPVIDTANLIQSIQQVVYWAQQLEQMKNQLDQQVQHLQAITGSRNLGGILNDQQLQQFVPQDAVAIYNSIKSGDLSKLTQDAQAIRNSTMIYNCSDRIGDDYSNCQANLNKNAQDLAYAQNAYKLATQRVQQIQGLIGQINTTQDPKAIAELQARIQGENTAIANEQNRLTIWQSVSQSQDRAIQQKYKEQEMQSLSRKGDGTENFQFQLPQ